MTAAPSLHSTFDEAQVDRFAFGRNWLNYQSSIDHDRLVSARQDIEHWLQVKSLAGKRVLDIGSGSGVHSYCMHAMGASRLVSFDYDADSVRATREFHAKAGSPDSWTVLQASVLDTDFLASLGTFDIVYSWGVLHHTGQMWKAIANAAARVADGGQFFISIYAKGRQYQADLELKQRYHRASLSGKRKMEFDWILEKYHQRARAGQNPEGWWTEGQERGMDAYYDLVDWLGGLPYEVATLHELTTELRTLGIETQRTRECPGDGGCHILVGSRAALAPVRALARVGNGAQPARTAWPVDAPALWVGAFDQVEAPERVVPLARALPDIPFLIVADGYAELAEAMRREIESLAPNLRIIDRPDDHAALGDIVLAAGVLLHTADSAPGSDWVAMAASAALPVVSLNPDTKNIIRDHGLGIVGDGDLNQLAEALLRLRRSNDLYSRASAAGTTWLGAADAR